MSKGRDGEERVKVKVRVREEWVSVRWAMAFGCQVWKVDRRTRKFEQYPVGAVEPLLNPGSPGNH
jgi:hypothetical protein